MPCCHEDVDGAGDFTPTVLMVDDSEDLMALARLALSRHWAVHTAKNGLEALKILDSTPIDCVVTDAMMPVMDGATLIATLRSDVKTAVLPIVLLTGQNNPAGASAANLVLHKPFRIPDLIAAVEQLIATTHP